MNTARSGSWTRFSSSSPARLNGSCCPIAGTRRIAIALKTCWRRRPDSSPQRCLELGDSDFDLSKVGEHALGLADRLAQRLLVRRAPASNLPRQVPRRLRTGAAHGERSLVRLDEV